MKSSFRRALGAACLLSALAAPGAHAVVIQNFSTTQNFGGYYAYAPLGGSAAWNAAQSAAPLASVTYELTIAGSFTLLEGNPWQFAMAWTPTLALSFQPWAPGLAVQPAVQYSVTGATQTLPGQAVTNVVYFQPVTLSFSQHFSFTITGSALAAYQGTGSLWLGATSSFWPNPYYGQFSGAVTHNAALTYTEAGNNAALPGAAVPARDLSLALLALGLTVCGLAHRLRRVRSLPGVWVGAAGAAPPLSSGS